MKMFNPQRSCSLLIAALLFSLPLAILAPVFAEDGHDHSSHDAPVTNFQEGKHFYRISPAVETDVEEGKVEVLELFWYGCPHCFQFEPHLTSWRETMSDKVSFVRMPAVLNRSWLAHARAFYALETMGELERIHTIFFEAIHVQGRRLRDVESMTRFLSGHDVDAEKFKSAYNSLYVETKINRSGQLVRQYGSSSVPTVIINGKYRTSAKDAGGFENVLKLVDQLVEQEAGAGNASASADSVTTEESAAIEEAVE